MIQHKQNIFHKVITFNAPSRFTILTRKVLEFCMHSSSRKYIATILFIFLSILIGTLIVYFTSPKSKYICRHIHRRTVIEIGNYRSHPQSVAINHFNGDTVLDFIAVNTGLDNFDIYLGLSNGTFEHHATYSTGSDSQPCSVAVGNFDNQDSIDIAVANFGTNSIVIFVGMGDGSFTFKQFLSTSSSRPLMIAVADLNNDHRLDIAVLNYGTNSIDIFLASQDGSYGFSTNYPTGYDSLPKSFAIADLNNDNHFDIVVANFGTNNTGLFLGKENGTFENQKIYSTGFGSNPSSVIVDDLDHDDHLDVIVANYGTNDIAICYGYRNGSFMRQMTYSTGRSSRPEFIAVYDFNGDSQLDIIAVDSIYERVYILPGNEDGTFPSLSMYLTDFGSNPISIGAADFNHNNKSDVLVVNRDANNILLLVGYDIKLSMHLSILTAETFKRPKSIATGDLNGDNLLDMVVINQGNNLISVFLGHGNGSFSLWTNISTNIDSLIEKVILCDLNNDHQLDIVVLLPDNNSFSTLLGHGDVMFSPPTTHPTRTIGWPNSLAAGDVNKDNCLDIVIVGVRPYSIGIFIGNCNGNFEMLWIYEIQMLPWRILMDDLDGDSTIDLIISSPSPKSISLFLGDGTGSFQMSQMPELNDLSSFSYGFAPGDFNNDNRRDLAVSLCQTDNIMVLLGYESNAFRSRKIYSIEHCYYPTEMVADNFNGDTQPDLAILCTDSKNVAILFGSHTGEFSVGTIYSIETDSLMRVLVSGDFNNDNISDIAIADETGNKVRIMMSYYKADFAMEMKYLTGSSPQPYSIAVADLNHDNTSDLIVANSGNKNIDIRLGLGNGSFGVETTYPTGSNSFPQYVTVGDLNGDDEVDIVVVVDSNGHNILVFRGNDDGTFANYSTYSMDLQSSPTCVAITNLNNDKWADLIVTNQETDHLTILYGYNYATFVLHQTYTTGNQTYPEAVVVADIDNDNRLDIIVTNIYLNNIGIFFGDDEGSFTQQRTYSTGAMYISRAMTVAELNKDGCLDIIVASRYITFVGVLLGDCNRNFKIIISQPVGENINPSAMFIGDINDDDQLDVIITDHRGGTVIVLLGFGNGSLSLKTVYSTGSGSQPYSIDLGDLNNDQHLDIVVALAGSKSVCVLLGYGDGSFAPPIFYFLRSGSQTYSVVLGDFNHDDQLDMAVANSNLHCIEIFLGYGNGNFSSPTIYSLGDWTFPFLMNVDYFNDDDRLDIAVICDGDRSFTVLFGTESGSFVIGKKYRSSSPSLLKVMASGDFNNDSYRDVVVVNTLDDKIDIFLGNEDVSFGMASNRPIGFGLKPHSLAVGDFDNDNRSDIVVANYGTDDIGIILTSAIDSSTYSITYSTGVGSRPYAVAVDDFNGDSELDVAVISFGNNSVIIFEGNGDGSFREIGSYSTGIASIPRSIAVTDFDNDQKLDLVIANAGANNVLILFGLGNGTFGRDTLYSMGYDSRPYSVAVGDFDRDGWMDMAVANFGADYVEILLQPC